MPLALIILYPSAIVAMYMLAIRREWDLFNFAPSGVWLTLVLLPFFYQFNRFAEKPAIIQMWASIWIFACLFSSDLLSCRSTISKVQAIRSEARQQPTKILLNTIFALAIFCLIIQGIHYALAPTVPLMNFIIDPNTPRESLKAMRELTNKKSDLPRAIFYLGNWTLNILGPVCIAFAYKYRRPFLAITILVTNTFFSLYTLAKFPLFFFVLCTVVAWLACNAPQYFKCIRNLIVLLILTIPPICIVFTEYSSFSFKQQPVWNDPNKLGRTVQSEPAFTLTDEFRVWRMVLHNTECGEHHYATLNYLIYRVVLAPVEVAHRWYHLAQLPDQSSSAIRESNVPNKVAQWAYIYRFPSEYPESTSAYASADADAYFRYGNLGVLVVGVLCWILRLLISTLQTNGPICIVVQYVSIVLFAASLPNASLQAILGAQGVCIAIILALWKLTTRSGYPSSFQ